MNACLSVDELRQLENASWETEGKRALYSTPHIPGFPWYTVALESSHREPSVDASISDSCAPPIAQRWVVPYDFTFKVFVKGRWVGRELLEVYTTEFPHHSHAYYAASYASGRLTRVPKQQLQAHNVQRRAMKRALGADANVSSDARTSSTSDENYERKCCSGREGAATRDLNVLTDSASLQSSLLQNGDVVLHTMHRHEIPVPVGLTGAEPIALTAVCIKRYGLLCVSKPTGVPTHATGRYQYNSLLGMLEYVLAPKRLSAWLKHGDPLLQSLVSTAALTEAEKEELFEYYSETSSQYSVDKGGSGSSSGEVVSLEKTPRPCHRLDKVTSGVLLLGVSQEATKRVGVALMRKTQQLDEAVQAALVKRPTLSSGNSTDEGARESALAAMASDVVQRNYGVRKRYLARVFGTTFDHEKASVVAGTVFPSLTLDIVQVSAAELADMNGATAHWIGGHMKSGLRCSNTSGMLVGEFPDAILVGTTAAGVATTSTTTELPSDEADAEGSSKASATLCQRLFTVTEGESVVHCIPFTGRLHQIRRHLSQCGVPIVGDVVYRDARSAVTSSAAATTVSGGVTDFAELLKRDGVVLFRPQDLPGWCKTHGGVLAHPVHVKNETGESNIEPLCYECVGRLPVAMLGECSGTSSVCLHAWRYELDESLLDATPQGTSQPNTTMSRYLQRSNGEVVFCAPPPAWALPEGCQ